MAVLNRTSRVWAGRNGSGPVRSDDTEVVPPGRGQINSRRRRWWCVLLLALAAPLVHAANTEYDVKAAFLYNFTTFVEWPGATETPAGDEPPFVIGIVGENPFGTALHEIVAQETVRGRPLVVRQLEETEVANCDILFISRSETGRLDDVLERIRGRPVLTVSDIPRFAETGGMIGFTTEHGRVRLAINTTAVTTQQLAVSAKLLRLARIVKVATR